MANIVIKTFDKFDDELVNKWQELYKAGGIYNLSPQWCKVWFKIFGKNKKLHIIAIYDKRDNLKLIAPFYIKGKVLMLIGNRPCFYDECNILSVDKEHMEVLLDYIFENKLDINFTHVNAQSTFAKILQRYLCAHKIKYTAHLSEAKQIINKEFAPKHGEMKNINRQKRYVENNMNDSIVFEYDIPKKAESVEELVRLNLKRWGTRISDMPVYIKELFLTVPGIKISRLSLASNNKTLAYELGAIDSNNKYWFLMSAFDYDYNKISPGKVLMYDLTKYLLENGIEILDLGRGCEAYKGGYSNEENILIHFNTYNASLMAQLYVRIDELIEKLVKKLRDMA